MNNLERFKNFEGLKLVSFNIHSRNTTHYSLPYVGTEEERMKELAQAIIETGTDVVCINEVAPIKAKMLLSVLREAEYDVYFPVDNMYRSFDDCSRMSSITVLAIKNGVTFEQSFEESNLPYRMVTGILKQDNCNNIAICAIHIPSVDNVNNEWQMFRKRTSMMEISAYISKMEGMGMPIVLLGDMNTDSKEDACAGQFSQIEKKLVDKLPKSATWEKKRLDRILISKEIEETCRTTVSMVDTAPVLLGLTDHAIVGVGLQFEKEEG